MFLGQLLTAGIYLIAARGTDPAAFGRVVAAIGVGLLAISLLEFGTNTLWLRELAAGRIGVDEYGTRLTGKIAVNLIVGLFSFAILSAQHFGTAVLLTVPYCFSIQLATAINVGNRAAGLPHRIGWFTVADRLTAVVMLLVLMGIGVPAEVAMMIGLTLGGFTNAVISFFCMPVQFRPRFRFSRGNPWKGTGAFGAFGIATSVQSLDVTVLAVAGGAASAGLYGAVTRWTQPMMLLASAVAQVLAPLIAASSSNRAAIQKAFQQAWVLCLAVTGCIGVAFFAPTLVSLLLGEEYADSGTVLRLLAIATIPAVMNQPLIALLQLRGLQRAVAISWGLVALGQVAMIAITAGTYGALAAAYSSLFAQTILFVVLGGLSATKLKGQTPM
ncbi:lipopolysaccharide biosynthesis protein [Mycolicibacterium parafortuitum]|uniref:lipopolysaccharide biosynthesis protein n=1 Tax=Mycolicibacterium parafortuitum TaxID=39692 RepID=UPI0032C4604C